MHLKFHIDKYINVFKLLEEQDCVVEGGDPQVRYLAEAGLFLLDIYNSRPQCWSLSGHSQSLDE